MIAPATFVRQKLGSDVGRTVVYHGFVLGFGFVMLYPLLWMAASSFKPGDEIFSNVM